MQISKKAPQIRFGVVTLFPEMFDSLTRWGITGRSLRQGLWSLDCFDPRNEALDRHSSVDDRPYGGGPGMVMKAPILKSSVNKARQALDTTAQVIAMTPHGQSLDSTLSHELSLEPALILVCGRYEGIDERFIEAEVDLEISIGDYVVSGGELPAMMLIDSVVRWLPGALGHADSVLQDSFVKNLLDYPHYTRPEEFDGRRVPDVLMSGDHADIAGWRRAQALKRTIERRPDILSGEQLSEEDRQLIAKWDLSHEEG